MFLAGWVHRDVSAGNILLYGDRGLIADLEYAKKEDMGSNIECSSSQKDPKMVCHLTLSNFLAN